MRHKNPITDETKTINNDSEIYPDDYCEECEEMEAEPDGYMCSNCGNIQKDCNSYTCRRCYGDLIEWYF